MRKFKFNKKNTVQIVGVLVMFAEFVINAASDWVDQKEVEDIVDERVRKILSKTDGSK